MSISSVSSEHTSYLYVCVFVSICMYVCLFQYVCLCVCFNVYVSVFVSMCMFLCLFLCGVFVCLYVYVPSPPPPRQVPIIMHARS